MFDRVLNTPLSLPVFYKVVVLEIFIKKTCGGVIFSNIESTVAECCLLSLEEIMVLSVLLIEMQISAKVDIPQGFLFACCCTPWTYFICM